MKSTHATNYLKSVGDLIESKPANFSEAIRTLAWGYSGDENRFIRQEIIDQLTGEKNILAKCGIRALAMHTEMYLARLGAEANAPAPTTTAPAIEATAPATSVSAPATKPTATIVLAVIRKACKRTGTVTAIEGQHVTVTLEDGSKRKPCMSRFEKLYIQA